MLIGIDGRALNGAMAGSGRYVTELCRALDHFLPHARFVVFCNVPITLPVCNSRWTLRTDESAWGKHLSPFTWYLLRVGRLAQADGVTAFWGGANFLPLGLPNQIRAVVTVLDLVHRVLPQSMSIKNRLAFAGFFRSGLKRADVLVAISNGTSSRLNEFGYKKADLVVHPGVDDKFRPASSDMISAMREALDIPCPYVLSVSTLEPRKNLRALITAFITMRRAGELSGIALVLAGQAGWKNNALLNLVSEARELGCQILLTGHVADAFLPALYAGAEAVVVPSIYEGFGLPILEARMCGARVIASDTPETREAGGRDVTYVDPTVEGIQAGIRHVLRSPKPEPSMLDPCVPRWSEEGRKLAQAIDPHGVAGFL